MWGTVSEAVDPHGRRVALKELHPTLVAGPLFLGINDRGLDNNDGAFTARVTVTRK